MLAAVMLVFSVLLIGFGVMLMDAAATANNEIAGLLIILCGTVLFCGACVVDEIRRLRRDMSKYITRAVRILQKELSDPGKASSATDDESPSSE